MRETITDMIAESYSNTDPYEYTKITRADGFSVVVSSSRTLGSDRFELRKNGLMVARGIGSVCGDNLSYFPVPGTKDMLRTVLEDMLAEEEKKAEAERLAQEQKDEQERLAWQHRERVAAARVLGLNKEN